MTNAFLHKWFRNASLLVGKNYYEVFCLFSIGLQRWMLTGNVSRDFRPLFFHESNPSELLMKGLIFEFELGTICVSAFALAVLPTRQHPQTTYVPHARPGLGNGGGQRVRRGSTGPAPLPLDSTHRLLIHWDEKKKSSRIPPTLLLSPDRADMDCGMLK